MPNTYTQIHIQFVFAVKYKASVIQSDWKIRLYKYITGIIQGRGHKLLSINGVADHIHILAGFRPNESMPDLVHEVKRQSSKWINEEGFTKGKFQWQEGYGAFSYSKSQITAVANYIEKQEEHHKRVSFREEYLKILESLEIDFDEKYIFKELE